MKLGTLHKKILYRDLRSSLGYYDARRIMRFIEEDLEISSVDDVEKTLSDQGFDPRQISITVQTVKNSISLLK